MGRPAKDWRRGAALLALTGAISLTLPACGEPTDGQSNEPTAAVTIASPSPVAARAEVTPTATAVKPTPTPTAPEPTAAPQQSSNSAPSGAAIQPTVPPGWVKMTTGKTYRGQDNRFSIEYPGDWRLVDQRRVRFISPDEQATLTIWQEEIGGLATERKLVDAATLSLREEYGSSFREEQRQTLANGRIQLDYTIREQAPISGVILIDYKGTTMFVLTTRAPQAVYDRYESDFKDMIDSYTIN